MKYNKKEPKRISFISLGMIIGLILGIVFNNLTRGLAIGIVIGFTIEWIKSRN